MVRDGIVFKDEDGQVIFNQHSFCELVKHLLVELVGISYEEASQIVDRSPLAEPVADAMGVAMFSHDLPYYTNKIVDMFAADRTVSVELLCENKLMKTIIDHYGEAVPTRTYDEEHFTANIEVDPSGTFYGWVFKFMGGIQIIAPHECVEEMKRIARSFL